MLSQSDCSAHKYCVPVLAVPFSNGGTGGSFDPERQEPEPTAYLGCSSDCQAVLPATGCTYREDQPTECYWVGDSRLPDEGEWVSTSCDPQELAQCVY